MERTRRGLLRWRGVIGRWLASAYHDNALGLASQLSYDFLFLLAPGPLLVSAALSIFGTDPSTLASIIALLKNFLPAITHPIVDKQVASIVVSGLGGKLALVGILLAIYLGLNFVNTFTKSINHALGVHEMRRSWWSRSFLALLLLFWFSFTTIFGFNAVVFGEQVAATVVQTFGLRVPLEDIVAWAKYPIIALALTGVAHTLYLLTPEVYQTSRQALPGAVFFALGWLFATWLFRVYVEQYARYGEYYVSFASLAVLLTWIYVTSLLLLLGGWLNVVIRQEFGAIPAAAPSAPAAA